MIAFADDVLDRVADIIDPAPYVPQPFEADPLTWIRTVFPTFERRPFSPHQVDYWRWLWNIEPNVRPLPRVIIWSRGHAKSASAELGCIALGARRRRRYGLYVCAVQDNANDHLQTIANKLESDAIAELYPDLADRMMGKHGNSKGWNVQRLRCKSGFTMDAVGLDTATRGVKLDDDRPDFMVFDDIDDPEHSFDTIAKMRRIITQGLLPAGTPDVAVLGAQNLIRRDGIFADLAGMTVKDEDGREVQGPTFLQDRELSGPIPALIGVEHETGPDGKVRLTKGEPTWHGFDFEACQQQVTTFGWTAFKRECQHDVADPAGGMFSELEYLRCDEEAMPDLVKVAVAVDPAVTSKDSSDACAVQVDGLGVDGKLYRLASVERRMSPVAALTTAILLALELQADTIAVEDDQGGDTWQSVYREAFDVVMVAHPEYAGASVPPLTQVKAGTIGSKVGRAGRMLAAYELGWFVHVRGDHVLLEQALNRFPKKKPFDLTDAAFWSARALRPEIDQLTPSKRFTIVDVGEAA
jgi:hypothetical protein